MYWKHLIMYKNVLGIDLGTRSIHVSDGESCQTFISQKLNDRAAEVSFLFDCFIDVYGWRWKGYIEEPVVAGARNLRVSLQIAQISGALLATGSGRLVPVTSWKKLIVGKGNANKAYVADWFEANHPDAYKLIKGKQDHIDASCIQMYAEKIYSESEKL